MNSSPEFELPQLLREGALPMPHGKRMALQRVRLLASIGPELARVRARRRLARGLCAGLVAACVAAYGLTLGVHYAGESPSRVQVALDQSALYEGGWVESEAHERTLEFSEGSQVGVAPHSKARIGRLGPKQVDMSLESGALHARITKGTGLRWSIAAGPYRVSVVGTRFEVHWDFALERFRVAVSEGEVRVSGTSLPADGIRLTRGQSFTRAKPAVSEEVPPAPVSRAPRTQSQEPADRALGKATQAAAVPRGPELPKPESWQSLARSGNYAAALANAREAGMADLRAALSADDMLLLANTARYAGDLKTARSTFLKLRQRYPGHSAARLAAFSLGRLASDSQIDNADAVYWFRIFLQESPRGDLAAGARARLMSALLRQGDQMGARAIARDYLTNHPGGPHVETARSLASALPRP